MFKNLLSLLEFVLDLLTHTLHGCQVLCFCLPCNEKGAWRNP